MFTYSFIAYMGNPYFPNLRYVFTDRKNELSDNESEIDWSNDVSHIVG